MEASSLSDVIKKKNHLYVKVWRCYFSCITPHTLSLSWIQASSIILFTKPDQPLMRFSARESRPRPTILNNCPTSVIHSDKQASPQHGNSMNMLQNECWLSLTMSGYDPTCGGLLSVRRIVSVSPSLLGNNCVTVTGLDLMSAHSAQVSLFSSPFLNPALEIKKQRVQHGSRI